MMKYILRLMVFTGISVFSLVNAEQIEFAKNEVFIPARLGNLRLCKDDTGFFVIKDGQVYDIQNCFCDPMLQKMSNYQLKKFVGRHNPKMVIMTPEEFAKKIGGEERFSIALKTLVEGVIKAVAMELSILNAKPKEILFSGRLCRVNTIYESLIESIETRLDISTRRIRGFSSSTKEAAQGAALIANGLGKGVYKSLIDTMMLKKAKGTVLDYIYWPSFKIKDIMASKIKAMKT